MSETALAPVARGDRIDMLDILRGIAILGIFYVNVPYMGQAAYAWMHDIRAIGWSATDQAAWVGVELVFEGTQRGLLEFLFGAGMLLLARRAMMPDGPVAVADLYYRRNLWLIAFGLFDIFVLLWPGDILFIYGIAALALFPFRRLAPELMLALGLGFAAFIALAGGLSYASASLLETQVAAIEARSATAPATPEQQAALDTWRSKSDAFTVDKELAKLIAGERAARTPGAATPGFIAWVWQTWFDYVGKGMLVYGVIETWCAMMIGAALFKWGVIQGRRSSGFYLRLLLVCYAFGFTARALGIGETLSFAPGARTIWFTDEFARLAVTLGHVALVNWAMTTALGRTLLTPFKAAGRSAFSLYFTQQIVAIVVFAPFGMALWGRWGWAELVVFATVVNAALLVSANLYMRHFVAGPLEWLWRSLSYLERQPLRRRVGQ